MWWIGTTTSGTRRWRLKKRLQRVWRSGGLSTSICAELRRSRHKGPESDAEYVQEYGLGVSYHVLNQELHGGDAIWESLRDELTDPNMAIQNAMSEDEWETYDAASFGCFSEAIGGALRDERVLEAFFTQFGDQIEDVSRGVEADPRIVELDSKWSKCMSGAGYAFDDEEDAVSHVVGLLEEIGAVSVPASPQGAWDYEPKPIEAGSDTYKEVESIFKEEVIIAKASLKCREGAYEIYDTVYKEHEQAFIDNNRAALEQFREENS